MRLPRYSSTALPREQHLDPATAAAAAAAPGQFLAQAAGVVSDFAMQMRDAEDRSQSREQDAEASFKLKEFESDPRWDQDEIDGRPTEEVMFEEYDALVTQLEGSGEGIFSSEVRDITLKNIRSNAEDTGLRIRSKGNAVRIRRTKARDSKTIEKYRMGGDWESANSVVTEGYADGIYTLAERDALNEQTNKLMRLDPYISKIGLSDADKMNDLASDALTDPSLKAGERIDMWRALSSAADNVESEFYNDRNRRWRENSVNVWSNFDNLDPMSIATADLSPETKKAAIMMKRSERMSGKGVADDPGVVNSLYESIMNIGAPTGSGERATSTRHIAEVIAAHASAGEISFETAIKLQNAAVTFADKTFAGATFTDVLRAGEMTITRGVPSEALMDLFPQKKAEALAALSVEWRNEMVSSKIDQGPNFDPREFYAKNLQNYKDRADEIQNVKSILTIGGLIKKYSLPGGDFEIRAMLDEINESDMTNEEKSALRLLVGDL